jgi:hypothetical protein
MTDAFPTIPDDELRETLDLLSTVMASVSDRVDANTQVLDRLNKTATEARQASFAAKAQTDPEHYGELVGATINGKINDNLVRMGQMCVDLFEASNRAQEVLRKAEDDKSIALRQVWEREQRVDRLKSCLPWICLGSVVLALAMTVLLPRFLVSNASACTAFGASWTTTTTGVDACVFYSE